MYHEEILFENISEAIISVPGVSVGKLEELLKCSVVLCTGAGTNTYPWALPGWTLTLYISANLKPTLHGFTPSHNSVLNARGILFLPRKFLS